MEAYATATQVYVAGLVFARIGAMVMLVPGLGDPMVPARLRLSLAFLMALILTPLVGAGLQVPASVAGMAGAVIRELLIGLMIGGILRLFLNSLAVAGEVVAIQTTLGFAQTVNPAQGTPNATLGTFLSLMGTVLIMTTDLHHMFFAAMARSYSMFPFGGKVPVVDGVTLAVQTISGSFALGIQLSAPILVFSLVFNIAAGLVGRAMPQFQIYFASAPLTVLLGLSIFAMSLGLVGMIWAERYRDLLGTFS